MRIVFIGDSNTYGFDPRGFLSDRYEPENRWVDCLEALTGWECLNEGVCGRVIPRSAASLFLSPGVLKADMIAVMLGTNDLLQGATPEDAADRMEGFLTDLMRHAVKLLLISPPPMKRGAWVPSEDLVERSRLLADGYCIVAERLGIRFLDTREWNIDLAYDGVHFSPQGHRNFAERFRKALL